MLSTGPANETRFATSGTIRTPSLSWKYRAGLVVVAIAMLVLPILYGLLVASAAWLVWLHATADTWIVSSHANQVTLLLYFAPIAAGGCLVFFLVKPLVATSPRRDLLIVDPGDEPELMAFITALCRHVGAPVPRRVQVDCTVNASAGFMPGAAALLRRDLVLTIGLPLVAGLSVREFGGVLAHEFGHFTQGGAMRLSATVRGINHWFARVVYGRDKWDARLEDGSKSQDFRSVLITGLARIGVWISRQVLALLMRVGHGVSCFLMRQMEYDADAIEIQVAGSATFTRTMARLRELNAGRQLAYHDLQRAWQTRAIPKDLPQFIVEHEQMIEKQARESLLRTPDARTGMWDTHPSDADRVGAAERAGASGTFVGGDAPARLLFTKFDALCREVTRRHYRDDLRLDVDAVELVDAEAAAVQRHRREDINAALTTFIGRRTSPRRPLLVPVDIGAGSSEADLRIQLAQLQAVMQVDADQTTRYYREYEHYADRQTTALAAGEILLIGGVVKPGSIPELSESSIESAQITQEWARSKQQEHVTDLAAFEDAAARRLACGVLLSDRASGSSEMRDVAVIFNTVSRQLPAGGAIFDDQLLLMLLGRAQSANSQGLAMRSAAIHKRVGDRLAALGKALELTPCPRSLCQSEMSVAHWLGFTGAGARIDAREMVDKLLMLYFHLLGRMAQATLAVEEQLAGTNSDQQPSALTTAAAATT